MAKAAAEERLGDRLDEHTGDWTDWWADGIGSGARPLGYTRRAQNTLRHAETLHSVASAYGESTPIGGRDQVDAVYDELGLFDEHTWGAANPWHDCEDGFDSGGLQWGRKAEVAYRAFDAAEDLRVSGGRRLGAVLAPAAGVLASYAVVNAGPRARTDVVTFFVPATVVSLRPRLPRWMDEPVSESRITKMWSVRRHGPPDRRGAGYTSSSVRCRRWATCGWT